ncbi:VOC family protein [Roseicella frigidaeris]|uniref:VOC family protein n=1 Tax=Roseicella frigidaeris TaxID=2230885 RepID=UPI001FB54E53|nr:VOC family protein [Roseicella frigidaeris]
MFSHVTLGVGDIDRAMAFYDAVLAPLGLARQVSDRAAGQAGYAAAPAGRAGFWLLRPRDGRPASVGNGTTIAFEAADRATVDAVHAAALAAGGRAG